jgi:hypothetical protein
LHADIVGRAFQTALNTTLDVHLYGQKRPDNDNNQDSIFQRALPFLSLFI